MNLTWHIVRKDARHLAWPVGVWLGLMVAAAAGWLFVSWTPEKILMAEAESWMRTLQSAGMAMAVIGGSALVLLAGVLVLEDPVVGSGSFWLTRPIKGWRLLRAKLLGAGLLVLAPTLVLVPIWLAAGFDGGEVLQAAGSTAVGGAMLVVVALSFAALSANLGQQAFAALTALGLTTLTLQVLPSIWERGEDKYDAWETQGWLVMAIFMVAAAGSLAWQYRVRRTAFGWAIWVLALGAMACVRLFWSWDLSGAVRLRESWPEEQRSKVTLSRVQQSEEPASPSALQFAVEPGSDRAEFLAPMEGAGRVQGAGGAREVQLERGKRWASEAARRVAGASGGTRPVEWPMVGRIRGKRVDGNAAGITAFSGRVQFARMRGRVIYELPLHAGAVASAGGSRTRIVGWADNDPATLMVEERRAMTGGVGIHAVPRQMEVFLLVQRESGVVRDVQVRGHRGAGMFGLVLEVVAITPVAKEGAGRGGWTLVKVRFEPAGWFEREFLRLTSETNQTEEKR